MTEETGKKPPCNLEAERSVLGCMLLDQDLAMEALETLRPIDFFDRKHRIIFQACKDLNSNHSELDYVIVSNELKQTKRLEESGGLEYLSSLTADIPLRSNIRKHFEIIKDKSLLRQLLTVSRENIEDVLDGAGETKSILDNAERKILAIGDEIMTGEFTSISELVDGGIQSLEMLRDTEGYVTGLSTGFDILDKYTTGFHAGELIILAARPSFGKTSMALNMAVDIAQSSGRGVAIFSLEMSKELLTQRMLCADARVGKALLVEGILPPEQFGNLLEAADRLQRLNIFIDDTAGIGSMEMRAKVRNLMRKNDICMVIVDYLQLMRGEGSSENRQQEIAKISGDLKSLAKEMHIPVMALSQLSRLAANRSGPPRLSDLRESGAIEQDADLVLFLHRNDDKSDNEDENVDINNRLTTLKIGKQRNGPQGLLIKLNFNTAITRFFPLGPDDYGDYD